MAAAAGELGIELHQTARVSDPGSVERIRASGAEVGVVCAFGQLIREPLLSELEMLNVHPSLIPRWRGAAPIERAIMAGDTETGVTIMQVGAGLDSGPVALRERTPIAPEFDYGSLSARLAELGGELIVRALDLRAPVSSRSPTRTSRWRPTPRRSPPPSAASTPPGRRSSWSARCGRSTRTSAPTWSWMAASGSACGAAAAEDGAVAPGQLEADGRALRLGCREGVLRIRVVQPAGKRPMEADAYLRGHPLPRLSAELERGK